MNQPTTYSDREIDRMFGEIQGALGRIEEQTKKTNGRVTALQVWRGYITGGLAILTIIVLPIGLWVLSQIVSVRNSHQQINAAVADFQKSNN